MRRNLLKLVLTCLLLMGGLATSRAQTTPILPYSGAWQYLITNGLPQGGWTNVNYPPGDSWFFGGSVFSFPIDEAMPTPFATVQTLLSTNYLSTIVTSFYFRTSIILTQNFASNVVVNGAAIVDDGAVIYLNGREVTRIRMPTGNIGHNTLASGGGEVASRIDSFSIPGTNFIRGTNVMAVEVHQDLHTSSDVVFGMQLTPTAIDPVSILTNAQPSPPLQTVDTGHRTTLTVGAWGTSVRYQWYSNNVPVTGATSWSYQTPAFGAANTGIVYHVVASNALNSVRSSNAVVVVETDRNGPLISQVRTDGAASNRLLLTFNEPIAQPAVYPGVTNIDNYSVTVLGTTNRIAITNVQFGSVTLVRLFLNERVTSTNEYIICMSNIPDAKTNFGSSCATFDKIVLSNLFTLGSLWRFHNLAADLSGENWTSPNYDDGGNQSWGAGNGPLYFDPGEFFPPANSCYDADGGTSTGKGPRTFYYRKRLSFTTATVPSTTTTLNIRTAIDDGAVIYINGQEIQRVRMPAAPAVINYSTIATGPAPGPMTDAMCETFTIDIPRGLFRAVTNNVIAVEVHQQEANPNTEAESDNLFDMEMSFQRDIGILPASRLTITRGTGNVLVTWTGGTNFTFEASTNILGPWSRVAPNVGNNGFRTNLTAGSQQQFFRTRYGP